MLKVKIMNNKISDIDYEVYNAMFVNMRAEVLFRLGELVAEKLGMDSKKMKMSFFDVFEDLRKQKDGEV